MLENQVCFQGEEKKEIFGTLMRREIRFQGEKKNKIF